MDYDIIGLVKQFRVFLLIGGVIGLFFYRRFRKPKKEIAISRKNLSTEELEKINEMFHLTTQEMNTVFDKIDFEKIRYSLDWAKVEKWKRQMSQLKSSYEEMKTETSVGEMEILLKNYTRMLNSGYYLIQKNKNPYQSDLINEETDDVVFKK